MIIKKDSYDDYELVINEIFGPTIQGEGNNVGKICYFIRLQGCDQNPPCRWCDTMHSYKIDGKDGKRMTFKEIINELFERNKDYNNLNLFRIVITGGNPCMQQNLYEFVRYLRRLISHKIEVFLETQGTIVEEGLSQFDYITFSPKPPSSNIDNIGQDVTHIVNFLDEYNDEKVEIKIVIFTEDDLKYASTIFKLIGYKPNLYYTLQIGTECNYIHNNITADQVISYLYSDKHSLTMDIIRKIRVLPQVHNILKVK